MAARYGKDSGEYGKAGGVPKSERKRPARKSPIASSDPSLQPLLIPTPASTVNGNGKAIA